MKWFVREHSMASSSKIEIGFIIGVHMFRKVYPEPGSGQDL
jgi:hypothetical protein